MAKKLTNKELMQLTIDEEACKVINFIFKNIENIDIYYNRGKGYLIRKSAKEILEMYKKENQ